jgi:hypothetical protein
VVAAGHLKVAASIGKFTLFNIFDPGTIDAKRDFVFGFAGRAAGMAANAFAMVDQEAVIHSLLPTIIRF